MLGLTLDIGGALNKLPDNPFKITDLGVFISRAIGIGITFAAIGALIYLLWGAFEWITSGGEKGNVENARNKITHALIGLTIVVAAWAIFGLVQNFLGLNVAQINRGGGGGGGGSQAERGLRCPGPNCDQCPNWPTRRSDWVPLNDSRWQINTKCP